MSTESEMCEQLFDPVSHRKLERVEEDLQGPNARIAPGD
jgi:hypothetical protein